MHCMELYFNLILSVILGIRKYFRYKINRDINVRIKKLHKICTNTG